MASTPSSEMANKILDVAERLVQTQGYNGFSYADISEKLHIRTASLHYHFPTKAKLGETLMSRYHGSFRAALAALDRDTLGAHQKLEGYVQLYTDVLRRKRMCMCGMLAADFSTLPKPMRVAVKDFFDENEAWLTKVLEEGQQAKTLCFDGPPQIVSRLLLSTLEGAMLVARSYGDVSRFESVANKLLAELNLAA